MKIYWHAAFVNRRKNPFKPTLKQNLFSRLLLLNPVFSIESTEFSTFCSKPVEILVTVIRGHFFK